MRREPPASVRRQLRREIGFGCPVPGCGSPYLQWHHFDPPWRETQHHESAGMIALCQEHHDKADAGAFTQDQLRELKQQGANQSEDVRGRFDWLRRDLLAVVGGNMYYDTPIIFHLDNQPIIWLTRDEDGYMMLNVDMLSTSGEPRMQMRDNFWLQRGAPLDLESPPNGKLLRVKYHNGDFLEVKFLKLDSASSAASRYTEWQVARLVQSGINFPITAVEVHNCVAGTDIEFGRRGTSFGGGMITGSVFISTMAALVVGPDNNIPSDPADRWRYYPLNSAGLPPV
jgi:hypothetical protein